MKPEHCMCEEGEDADFQMCTPEMPTLTPRKYGGFKQKLGRFSKLHATSMAQNLPEIGRLPYLGVKMGQKCLQNKEPPYEIGRVGISGTLFCFFDKRCTCIV